MHGLHALWVTQTKTCHACMDQAQSKPAVLDLTSGPQPPQGTGEHVVKPDLVLPAPYTLGTA